MQRMLLNVLLFSLLAGGCHGNKGKNEVVGPCTDMSQYSVLATTFPFRLTDPQTGEDLVSGPRATIPFDSIWFLRPDGKSGYWVGKAYRVAGATYLTGPGSPGLLLEIGQPGRVIQRKINMTFKRAGCSFEITSITQEDNPVPLKKDSTGAFLIPYAQ
ncbi:hypothetical protein [Chitinophaga varians]|uniref:hypothetical protein n=1 Tax=Chitinophaga varians TaxID=2202339 RepID=UPI00165F6C37|nr:hypothetical protein [Chitinophaga varians]MBC9911310.1 hypothetical protein [Chitinophaga varians]